MERRDPEELLEMGMALLCMIPRGPEEGEGKCKAYVQGWHEGRYILLELPAGIDGSHPFEVGAPVHCKCRWDGHTWDFVSSVEAVWDDVFPAQVRALWPAVAVRSDTRQHERLPAAIPCNVITPEGTWIKGKLQDVCVGGCRLAVKAPAAEGDEVHISFTLPDGTTIEDVRSIIRSARESDDEIILGCQFADEETRVQAELDLFVATELEEAQADRRRLELEDNPIEARAPEP